MNTIHAVRALRGAAVAFAIAVNLSGCLAEQGEALPPPPTGGLNTWADVQAGLSGCSCHQSSPGAGGLWLAGPLAGVVNVDSLRTRSLSIVKRYNRATSTLYLTASGDPAMPGGMTSTLAEEIGTWIDTGAPE